tara:strand:+ start:420 stop:566 length:147 start_codon:yes stop_codon:yes gene_type:complete
MPSNTEGCPKLKVPRLKKYPVKLERATVDLTWLVGSLFVPELIRSFQI